MSGHADPVGVILTIRLCLHPGMCSMTLPTLVLGEEVSERNSVCDRAREYKRVMMGVGIWTGLITGVSLLSSRSPEKAGAAHPCVAA